MKRLHVHLSVENIGDSVKFYSTLFGAEPIKIKADYAKWLPEDRRVNFAISTRGQNLGLDHFGIQVDGEAELTEVRTRLKKAEMKTVEEGETTCCYASADKTWVTVPDGLAWESYRTMADVETFGTEREKEETRNEKSACCAPKLEKEVRPKGMNTLTLVALVSFYVSWAGLSGLNAAGVNPGPFARALWWVHANGKPEFADPQKDEKTKGALYKSLTKDLPVAGSFWSQPRRAQAKLCAFRNQLFVLDLLNFTAA